MNNKNIESQSESILLKRAQAFKAADESGLKHPRIFFTSKITLSQAAHCFINIVVVHFGKKIHTLCQQDLHVVIAPNALSVLLLLPPAFLHQNVGVWC